ncbi:hypothetical protein E1262_27540 [Jiangella aurantiaca]|uniref:NAD(P)-binding domain-containing protein n=1 Tax=Jiangella aurantiaca TaxID=2530373 RepID=A0A4R4ZZV9_9ACTN|nr:hypothetical protein [Jiangella aurantiaca]TDD64655.1 hypothetical protein E1262_27540 [Jiangella aurantiaca]
MITNERAILVLGSTGTTGRRLVARLRDAGAPVRAASRHGDVPFDWSAPEMWEPALDGADRLHLMAPDGVPVDPAFVALAVESGVRRIVLLSSRGVEAMGDQRLLDAEATCADPVRSGPSCVPTGSTRTSTRASSGRLCWPASWPPLPFETYAAGAAAAGAWSD